MPLNLTDIETTDTISDGRVKINSNNAAIETFVNNLEDQITILESAPPPDADEIAVADVAGNFTATDVEGVLAELYDAIGNSGGGGPIDIEDVTGLQAALDDKASLTTDNEFAAGATFSGEVEFEAPVVIQDIPLRKALFGVGQAKHPAKARPSRIITQFQSGHGWSLANPRGTLSTDTTNYLFGSQSVKLTTEGDNSITGIRSGSLGGLDLSDRWLRLWVRVDDSTKLSQLVLYVTSDNFSGYQTYEVAIGGPGNGRTARDNEWFPITIDLENPMTTSGSVDLESISHLQLSVYDNGNPINVWYNEIALIHKKPGAVAIVFDDGLAGVWVNARPIMERYGIRGNVAVIASLVGESGCMTVDQLKHLDRYLGWDIIAHHYTNLEAPNGFDTMTEDELREEIELVQTWMFENGFHRGVHHVAYPFGGFNEASINILKDYFVTGRTIINGYETNPMADPMRLRSFNVTSSVSVSTITNLIDKAVANDELLILTFHNVVPGTPATDGEYNASDFEDIIEHLHNAGATVLTVPELVD